MEPNTDEEWRTVMALAEACLRLDSARQYGLLTGGVRIDADRCEQILARGQELGHAPPAEADIDAAIVALVCA